MKERPILFSTPMVQAILDGRKTQTRRIIKPQGNAVCFDIAMNKDNSDKWPRNLDADERFISYMKCPYGRIGDILWVRETFRRSFGGNYTYLTDVYHPDDDPQKWKPSIFMPKEACRIKLQITNIRVERLHEIMKDENIEDIAAEGIPKSPFMTYDTDEEGNILKDFNTYEFQEEYINLWESINGKGSWDKNPWVWVIEFKKL